MILTASTPIMHEQRIARLILGFWAAWYAFVVAGNLCDAARALGWLGAGWHFASGNFALVAQTIAIYGLSPAVAAILFAGVIMWELLCIVAFAVATAGLADATRGASTLRPFVVSLPLWMAFILADELFVAFPTGIEGTHLRIFVAHLVSLIVLRLLAK